MNLVDAWGVSSTLGFFFKTLLEELAQEELAAYTQTFFPDVIPESQGTWLKDKFTVAFGQGLKEFLHLVQKGLEDTDCSDSKVKQYINPLRQFIRHQAVLAELGKPFADVACDAASLAAIWYKLDLPQLPDEFPWKRITVRYKKKVEAIIRESDDLSFILQQDSHNNPVFLMGYREIIKKTYGCLRLDIIDPTGYNYNLKLWNMFVPQNVREVQEALPQVYELPKEFLERLKKSEKIEETDIAPEVLEYYKQVDYQQQPHSVLDIIKDEKTYLYTVILGNPGSGKSSLLQYLALEWAESPITKLPDLPIPLLVELRTYIQAQHDQKSPNPLDFFQPDSGFISPLNPPQLYQIHQLLQQGKAFVMFDGLDEVVEHRKREQVITEIIHFTKIYPHVRMLVTSRVISYQPQRLRDAKFRHFILQDLESDQIDNFINKWHDFALGNNGEQERKRERLRTAIHTAIPIKQLAGNPLLLTMMAILNRNQELPRDRAELYSQASRVLLQQWEVEKALVNETTTIDYKDKQAMLRQVAYQMQANKTGLLGNSISTKDLENILVYYLTNIKVCEPSNVAKLMINQLRERNFILCLLGADDYAFVHRTFLEYFCASEFVWQFEKERSITLEYLKNRVFGKHWQDEYWHEILRLIAGMLDVTFTGEIIDYLISQTGEEEKFNNLFLAAKCLSEVRNRMAILPTATKLLEQIKELTNYGNISLRIKSDRDLEYYRLVQGIRTQAFAVVATTWKHDPNTLSWLKQQAIKDDNGSVRSAAVQELARRWKHDPDTFPILKQRATLDNNGDVRSTAVQELARGWKDDPEIFPWLKQRATADKNWDVREAAVQELAWGWKHHPDTKPILKQRATLDDDSDVRRTAVQELARGWKDDPDTLPILKQRAIEDHHWLVRSAAVQELARGWKDDPDTLAIIKQRATLDDDSDVRRAAVQELVWWWKHEPQMLEFLCDRARNDPFDRSQGVLGTIEINPRQVALEAIIDQYPHHPQVLHLLRAQAEIDPDDQLREFAKAKLQE
ncbi:MAG: HEAT repeat domain-containing protein [Gloeotrichia echinulata IR180]